MKSRYFDIFFSSKFKKSLIYKIRKYFIGPTRHILQYLKLSTLKSTKSQKKIIVFIIPPISLIDNREIITGGLLSIDSLYVETKKIQESINARTILSTYPGSFPFSRFTQFKSKSSIFKFELLINKLKLFDEIIIHIPEYLAFRFILQLKEPVFTKYQNKLHINILNQNIDLMPATSEIKELSKFCIKLTQTTAHDQYTRKEIRDLYNIPLHKFSVFASPEKYNYIQFNNKKSLIGYSKDFHEHKEQLINYLKTKLPNYEFIEIKNLKYEEYRILLLDMKYIISFGEGLDFYFIENVFCGGISITVYNSSFFPLQFMNVPGLFNDFVTNKEDILDFIIQADIDSNFRNRLMSAQFSECAELYNYEKYRKNLLDFYCNKYHFA